MTAPLRDRFFAALARLGTRHPGAVLTVAGLVVVGSAALLPGLGVSTSRYGLVAEDDPIQARLLHFFDEFGYPDSSLIVIDGGDADQQRRVVDELVADLSQLPELEGRILARIGPRQIAEVMMLQRPEMMTTLGSSLAGGTDPADAIEGGIPAIARSLLTQINTFAVTMQMQAFSPLGRTITHEHAIEVIEGLTQLLQGATHSLGGDFDIWHELMKEKTHASIQWDGIDDLGYLAGASGEFHVVAMFPDLAGDEVADLKPFVARVRQIRDDVLARAGAAGISANVTGVPVLAVDEMDVLRKGIKQSGVATTIGVILLFFLAFRSLRQTILAGVPLLVGILVALALARVLYGELNLVTASAISVLLGLGIDFSVHTLARYNEMRRSGCAPVDAIARAVVCSGPAIAVGAVTTALAFLTTMTTDFTAFSELGVLTALGLLVTLLAAFLVVPPLIASSPMFHASAAPEVPGLDRLPGLVARVPRLWLAFALLLSVAAIALIPDLQFNRRYFDFLPAHTESAAGLTRLEGDRGMSPLFASIRAENMQQARELATKLRALPEVAGVQSPTDLLPPLTEALRDHLRVLRDARQPDFTKLADYPATAAEILPSIDGIAQAIGRVGFALQLGGSSNATAVAATGALAQFRAALVALPDHGTPMLQNMQRQLAEVASRGWRTAVRIAERGAYTAEDLPEIMQIRFAAHDRKAVALYVFPKGDPWDGEFTAAFTHALEALDPAATGFVITTFYHVQFIIAGFERAALLAGILVFLMLLWDFRSVGDAVLAALPLAMGWLWMLGLMSVTGLAFNVANIVALPLVLGIGVDAGVHVVHRCRESALEHGGVARLDELLRGTGGAVFLAALTTVVGFAGLTISDYGAMTSLGIAMVIGVSTCAFASLVVLPAVLVLLGRAR